MARFKFVMVALLLITAVGCGKKNRAEPLQLGAEEGTVYDQNGANGGRNGSGDLESDEINQGYRPNVDEDDLDSGTNINDRAMNDRNMSERGLDWEPVYFGFDESSLSEDAKDQLNRRAAVLKANPNMLVLLEGHCDTRGTEDYNLALGERRAQAVRAYLMELGVPKASLKTMSYGEMKPLDPAESESAWAKNRRVAFTF